MKRNGSIDLVRFISVLLIMSHHIYHLGIKSYPLKECWIYVEMFLLITGYYTVEHFEKRAVPDKAKEALKYTFNKYKPLFPYAFICSTCAWVTKSIITINKYGLCTKSIVKSVMGDYPFDLLFLSPKPLVAPLWYLAATILMFPIFVLLVQIPNKSLRTLICLVGPLIYYGWVGVNTDRTYPFDLSRVLAGMMMGAFLHDVVFFIKHWMKKIPRVILTLMEAGAFTIPVVSCYKGLATNGLTSFKFYYFCFFVFLTICLSNLSYGSKIHGKFTDLLGKLSMPMFIFHWYIGTLVNLLLPNGGTTAKIILYYTATIVVSGLMMCIIENRKSRKLRNRELNYNISDREQ